MNNKVLMLVVSILALLICVFLSRTWYSQDKRDNRTALVRENPAQLMPHELKHIANSIEILRRESLDDSMKKQCFKGTNPQPDPCHAQASYSATNATIMGRIHSDGEIISILANRRLIKILDEMNALPKEQNRAKALYYFDAVMTHFEKVVVDAFSSIQAQSRECHAVSFALYCLAAYGTPSDLIEAFARIERSEVIFLQQLEAAKRWNNIGPTTVASSYPAFRLRINILLNVLDKLGKLREHPELLKGLTKEIFPVPEWDAPLMTLEAVTRLFKEGESRPPFINPDGKWKEYIIYDWPVEYYVHGGKTKQLERVRAALEALRGSIKKTLYSKSVQHNDDRKVWFHTCGNNGFHFHRRNLAQLVVAWNSASVGGESANAMFKPFEANCNWR